MNGKSMKYVHYICFNNFKIKAVIETMTKYRVYVSFIFLNRLPNSRSTIILSPKASGTTEWQEGEYYFAFICS